MEAHQHLMDAVSAHPAVLARRVVPSRPREVHPGVSHAADLAGFVCAYLAPDAGRFSGDKEVAARFRFQSRASHPQVLSKRRVLEMESTFRFLDESCEMADLPMHDGGHGNGLTSVAENEAIRQLGCFGQT